MEKLENASTNAVEKISAQTEETPGLTVGVMNVNPSRLYDHEAELALNEAGSREIAPGNDSEAGSE